MEEVPDPNTNVTSLDENFKYTKRHRVRLVEYDDN